ncbi:hypothetical protein B0H17DRAFT_1331573 [Mycena rosella]|uniref:Uncharacterized protein n=1 Tax=Mycena rosella TaxID=1033263 RepID=A0AAD7DFP1_MYCRO|nr:hypothetical protein B0H17DRAFT_1331573 [Mycena rosella]
MACAAACGIAALHREQNRVLRAREPGACGCIVTAADFERVRMHHVNARAAPRESTAAPDHPALHRNRKRVLRAPTAHGSERPPARNAADTWLSVHTPALWTSVSERRLWTSDIPTLAHFNLVRKSVRQDFPEKKNITNDTDAGMLDENNSNL